MSIIIDSEFQSLIPPLTAEEYTQLEKNIIKDGIRDPLVVWPQGDGNDILVDGHNRFRITCAHSGAYHFVTVKKEFKDREEAKAWIIRNQIGRRNLSAYDRSVLALKLKQVIADKASETRGSRTDLGQKSGQGKTDKRLAHIANVSHDTIHKVETIEKSDNELVKQKARTGEISINKAYNIVTDKEPKSPRKLQAEYEDKLKTRHEEFEEKKKTEKLVSFDEARKDKADQKELAMILWNDLMKMGRGIDAVYGSLKDKEGNIAEMMANIEEYEAKQLKEAIERWRKKIAEIYMEVLSN